jgi:hypothetical protein
MKGFWIKGVALALLLGAGAYGVLSVEVEEANATVTNTFILAQNGGVDCTDYADIRKMVITGGNTDNNTVSFTDSAYAPNGHYCGSSPSFYAYDTEFNFTSNMTSIPDKPDVDWHTFHAAIGWKVGSTTIDPGEHTTTLTELGGCYIKQCTSSTCYGDSNWASNVHVNGATGANGYYCVFTGVWDI